MQRWVVGGAGARPEVPCCPPLPAQQDYVGRGFFTQELGLGERDFQQLCKWSGWACHHGGVDPAPAPAAAAAAAAGTGGAENGASGAPSTAATGAVLKDDPNRRRAVGRMCKRLIDLGRIHFLRSLLWCNSSLPLFVLTRTLRGLAGRLA